MDESHVSRDNTPPEEGEDQPEGTRLIRLEGDDKATASPPRTPTPPLTVPVQAALPIPAYPVHLCPNCDYNLTGLTSRRCPECGEPFDLRDARYQATRQMPGVRRFYRKATIDRWAGRISGVLLTWAILMPNLEFSSGWPWVTLGTSADGWFILTITAIAVLWGWLGQAYWDLSRPRVVLVAATLVWLLSLAVTFL